MHDGSFHDSTRFEFEMQLFAYCNIIILEYLLLCKSITLTFYDLFNPRHKSTAFGNPTFQTFDCGKLTIGNEYDLCIFVDFADRSDDVLLLNKDHGEETVFTGTLMKEKTAVSVIFEDDDEIEVRI